MQSKQQLTQPESQDQQQQQQQQQEQQQKTMQPDTPPLQIVDEAYMASEKELLANDQLGGSEVVADNEDVAEPLTQAYVVSQPVQSLPQDLHSNYFQSVPAAPSYQQYIGHQAAYGGVPGHNIPAPASGLPTGQMMYGSSAPVMYMPVPIYQTTSMQMPHQMVPAGVGEMPGEGIGFNHHQNRYHQQMQPLPLRATPHQAQFSGQQSGHRPMQMMQSVAANGKQPMSAILEGGDNAVSGNDATGGANGLDAPAIYKTQNRQRVVVWSYCQFCQNNREPEHVFRSHTLRDSSGRVVCPVLRSYNCPICNNGGGDKAHTKSYCPQFPKRNSHNGRRRSNNAGYHSAGYYSTGNLYGQQNIS